MLSCFLYFVVLFDSIYCLGLPSGVHKVRCLKDKTIFLASTSTILLKTTFEKQVPKGRQDFREWTRFTDQILVRCITIKIKIAYEAEIVKVVIEEETLTKHLQHTHTSTHARIKVCTRIYWHKMGRWAAHSHPEGMYGQHVPASRAHRHLWVYLIKGSVLCFQSFITSLGQIHFRTDCRRWSFKMFSITGPNILKR